MKYIVIESNGKKEIYQYETKNQKELILKNFSDDCKFKIFNSEEKNNAILFAQSTDIIDLNENNFYLDENIYNKLYYESHDKRNTLVEFVKNYNSQVCTSCLFEKFCEKSTCFYSRRKQNIPSNIINFSVYFNINLYEKSEQEWFDIINNVIGSIYIKNICLRFEDKVSFNIIEYLKHKNYNLDICLNSCSYESLNKKHFEQIVNYCNEYIIDSTNYDEIENIYKKIKQINNNITISVRSNLFILSFLNFIQNKNFNISYFYFLDNNIAKINKPIEVNSFFSSLFDKNNTIETILFNKKYNFLVNSNGSIFFNENFVCNLNTTPLSSKLKYLSLKNNNKIEIYADSISVKKNELIRIVIKGNKILCKYIIPLINTKTSEQKNLIIAYTALKYASYFSEMNFKSYIYINNKKIVDYFNNENNISKSSFILDTTSAFYLNNIELYKDRIWYKNIIVEYSENCVVNDYFLPMEYDGFCMGSYEKMPQDLASLYIWEKNLTETEYKIALVKAKCMFPWDCSQCNINNMYCLSKLLNSKTAPNDEKF